MMITTSQGTYSVSSTVCAEAQWADIWLTKPIHWQTLTTTNYKMTHLNTMRDQCENLLATWCQSHWGL